MDSLLLCRLKPDLSTLTGINNQYLNEIVELSWAFITQGISNSIYNTAAGKLNIDRKSFQSTVEAVAFLFIEAAKCDVNQDDFMAVAEHVELPDPIIKVLYQVYSAHRNELLQFIRGSAVTTAEFVALEWRLQSQLASRSIRGGLDPQAILKLDLERGGRKESLALSADISNIVHWSEMVEQALAEAKTHNSKKIQRSVS